MKIIIISDSHGNIANIKLVLGFAGKIKADGIIHCGDWDNLRAVKMVYSYKIPVYGVLGNADIDPRIAKMVNGQWLKIDLGNRKIGITHNYLAIKHQPLVIGCDIVFCGHRHFKSERTINGVKVISPGALHSSELSSHTPPFRSLCKPSFAVYDTDINGVEFFDL